MRVANADYHEAVLCLLGKEAAERRARTLYVIEGMAWGASRSDVEDVCAIAAPDGGFEVKRPIVVRGSRAWLVALKPGSKESLEYLDGVDSVWCQFGCGILPSPCDRRWGAQPAQSRLPLRG